MAKKVLIAASEKNASLISKALFAEAEGKAVFEIIPNTFYNCNLIEEGIERHKPEILFIIPKTLSYKTDDHEQEIIDLLKQIVFTVDPNLRIVLMTNSEDPENDPLIQTAIQMNVHDIFNGSSISPDVLVSQLKGNKSVSNVQHLIGTNQKAIGLNLDDSLLDKEKSDHTDGKKKLWPFGKKKHSQDKLREDKDTLDEDEWQNKYIDVQEELKDVKAKKYQYEKEIDEYVTQNEGLSQAISELKAQIEQLKSSSDTENPGKIVELQNIIEEKIQKEFELKEKLSIINTELKNANEQREHLINKVQKLEAEIINQKSIAALSDTSNLSLKINELEQRCSNLEREKLELEKKLLNSKPDNSILKSEEVDLKETIRKLEKANDELDSYKQKYLDLEDKLKMNHVSRSDKQDVSLQNEIDEKNTKIKNLEGQLYSINSSIEENIKTKQELQIEVAKLNQDKNLLEIELKNLGESKAALERNYNYLKEEKNEWESKNELRNEELLRIKEEISSEKISHKIDVDKLNAAIKEKEYQKKSLENILENMKQEASVQKSVYDEIKLKNNRLEQEIISTQSNLESLKHEEKYRNKEFENKINGLEIQVSDLQKENRIKEDQIRVLENERVELKSLADQVPSLKEAKKLAEESLKIATNQFMGSIENIRQNYQPVDGVNSSDKIAELNKKIFELNLRKEELENRLENLLKERTLISTEDILDHSLYKDLEQTNLRLSEENKRLTNENSRLSEDLDRTKQFIPKEEIEQESIKNEELPNSESPQAQRAESRSQKSDDPKETIALDFDSESDGPNEEIDENKTVEKKSSSDNSEAKEEKHEKNMKLDKKKVFYTSGIALAFIILLTVTGALYRNYSEKKEFSTLLEAGKYEQAAKLQPDKINEVKNYILVNDSKAIVSFQESNPTKLGTIDELFVKCEYQKLIDFVNKNKNELDLDVGRSGMLGLSYLKIDDLETSKKIAERIDDDLLKDKIKTYEENKKNISLFENELKSGNKSDKEKKELQDGIEACKDAINNL